MVRAVLISHWKCTVYTVLYGSCTILLFAMKESSCDVLARAHTIWGLGAKRLVLTVRVT